MQLDDNALEAAAKALVDGARENGLNIVSWEEMADGPKEANRKEARRCVQAYLENSVEWGPDEHGIYVLRLSPRGRER